MLSLLAGPFDEFPSSAKLSLRRFWNGSVWTKVSGPALGEGRFLNGVAAVSASSAIAVGINGPGFKTLTMRCNGTA